MNLEGIAPGTRLVTMSGDIVELLEVSGDGGFTWSDLPLIDDSLLRGVSCSATRCWAVGDGGAILASA